MNRYTISVDHEGKKLCMHIEKRGERYHTVNDAGREFDVFDKFQDALLWAVEILPCPWAEYPYLQSPVT